MGTFTLPAWQNEEFFERFAGPAAWLVYDGAGARLLKYNKAYAEELETDCVAPEEVDLICTVKECDRESYRQAIEKAAQTEKEQTWEGRRLCFSQLCGASEVWIRTRLSFAGKTPEGTLLFASVRNITKEKRLALAMDSETRFRQAAEQANVYAWEYNIATKEMRPCYRCMRDLGLPPLVKNYPEPAIEAGIFPQDYADMYRNWHKQIAAGAKSLEAVIPLTPARVPFHVRYTTVFDNSGNPIKAYGSATQAVDNEKEQEYKDIIACLGKVFFGLYYCELATGDFHQLEEPDLASTKETVGAGGKADEAFLRMSKALVVPEMAEEILKFTDYTTVAERLKNRDSIGIHFIGSHIGWCEGMFIAAKRDSEGNCTHVIWGVRSIRQQKEKEEQQQKELEAALKKTEEALREAERANAARASFLSRMSHDIRTPLNGIIGLIEIDERHAEDVALLKSDRAKAKTAANHLLALISDVLELSKIDDKNVKLVEEPFDISAVEKEVETIAGLRAAEKGITLSFPNPEVFKAFPHVFGSPLYVKQMMLNIIGNAVKYNRQNGSVTCSVKVERTDAQTARYTFTVKDTGIGMSPEFLRRLYEPFMQEHSDARSVYQGTGLGMSIVKSLVDKMRGSIDVQSEVNVGTTFIVSLPFRLAEEADMPRAEAEKQVNAAGARVLVAEDNDLNMDIIVTLLEEWGVQVTQARNGQEAVDIYAAHAPDYFDLILMDLMMPVLDGFGATEKIRAMDPPYNAIPIVAMTANAFQDDVRACLEKGMNGHLSKPIDVSRLMRTVAEYKEQ